MGYLNKLLLSKFLLKKGESFIKKDDPMSSGLAISLFQDAAELVLCTVAAHIEADTRERDGFIAIWEKVNSKNKSEILLPFKEKMFELNKARVGFKHYGIQPDPSHAFRYFGFVTEFINITVKKFLRLEFENISLSDTVSNKDIREHLRNAEKHLKEGNFRDSLVSSEIAYQRIFNYVEKILPEISLGIEDFGDKLQPAYDRDELGPAWSEIVEFLRNMRLNVLISLLGISISDFRRYRRFAPGVFIARSGKISKSFSGETASKDDVHFCLDFIISVALEAQNRF